MLARPTEAELEAAWTLRELPRLVRAADRRAGVLRWGARRRRSGPADDPPPPHPPTAAEDKKLSTSPVTPRSFPPSAGDDTDSRAPAPSPLKPRSRISKPLNQRVIEMKEKVTKLSGDNENLKRLVAEARSQYEALKASNSWLQGVQLKMAEEEKERQRRNRFDLDLLSVGPASPSLGPHYPHRAAGNPLGGAERRRWEVPDTSAGAEEARRSAMRAAVSAQARKRRLEIQREKSGCYSYTCSPTPNAAGVPSLTYKMPTRFR